MTLMGYDSDQYYKGCVRLLQEILGILEILSPSPVEDSPTLDFWVQADRHKC